MSKKGEDKAELERNEEKSRVGRQSWKEMRKKVG